jgi:hypothetical protein
MSESVANIILNKVKNAGIAIATARIFDEVQGEICRL